MNECALRLGVALRQTEDELMRNLLAGAAVQINMVNGVNGDVPTEITFEDISQIVQGLLGNDARMFLSSIEGENKFGTSPVRNAYFALAHTDLTTDLNNINQFIHQSQYPNQQRVLESEWGAVGNTRFLISSIGIKLPNASALGNTVYGIPFLAQEAVATIEQSGATNRFIYRPAIYSDALAQNVTVAAKFASAYQVLNDEWVFLGRATLGNA